MRIVKKLKAHGLKNNTLIIFSNDNGSPGRASERNGDGPESVMKKYDHHANAPWHGLKGDAYECGHRVPFIAKWPARIPAGSQCDELITLEDFMATCAAIIGDELPNGVAEDSFNIFPFLERGGPYDKNKPVVTKHGGPQGQLFNLDDDPVQTNNIWKHNPKIIANLTRLHAEHQSRGRSIGINR
ncbi:sulfatase-like hydrolase/transferase [Verrucomicrobia bacterium]|nr:sulfatase-like hydrolase/transferase [Verrucomicrobiota bacterium]